MERHDVGIDNGVEFAGVAVAFVDRVSNGCRAVAIADALDRLEVVIGRKRVEKLVARQAAGHRDHGS